MRLPTRHELGKKLLSEARKRRHRGLGVYGDFNPLTDKRILSKEGQEEVEDAYNYAKFYGIKYPHRKEAVLEAQRKLLDAYGCLEVLLVFELEETQKEGGAP